MLSLGYFWLVQDLYQGKTYWNLQIFKLLLFTKVSGIFKLLLFTKVSGIFKLLLFTKVTGIFKLLLFTKVSGIFKLLLFTKVSGIFKLLLFTKVSGIFMDLHSLPKSLFIVCQVFFTISSMFFKLVIIIFFSCNPH